MKFYTVEQIGPKRRVTPEGYLLCEDVPLARTGTQIYQDGEVPVPAKDGVIRIQRDPDEVFRPETVASAMGKDLVDEHPYEAQPTDDGFDVNPENYRELTRGVVLNPRRGEGTQSDLFLADILVKDANAIKLVQDGKVELSCGYNADYETLEPGLGRQRNIVINHVALVDAGRCGARCSIGDEDTMRTRDGKTVNPLQRGLLALNRIRDNFKKKTLDEGMLTEGMSEVTDALNELEGEKEAPDGTKGTHIHIHSGPAAGTASNTPNSGEADAAEGVIGSAETGGDPMDVMAARLGKLEAAVAKLVGMGGKIGGEEDPGETLETEGEPADTEGEQTTDEGESTPVEIMGGELGLQDPAPAATGDSKPVGYVVKDAAGKLVVRPFKKKPVARARDSAHLAERFSEVVSKAEILSPGITMPTFDAKADAAKTMDSICKFRRSALLRAFNNDSTKSFVISALGSKDLPTRLPKMTCDTATVLFNGAVELARATHNHGGGDRSSVRDNGGKTGPKSLGDINAANRERWNQPKR